MHDKYAALSAIVDRHGSFQRQEAIQLGLEDRDLRRGTRSGQLVKVRHGAYTLAPMWQQLDDPGRHGVLTRAVLRSLGDGAAASHHSACALHGLDLWSVPLERAHVTRLDGGAGRTEGDVVHHEGFWLPEDLTTVDGVRTVRAVRAVLESAMLSGVERGLVTASSGLHKGLFTEADLEAQHRLMESWPDSRGLHLVTRLARSGCESVGEARSLYLFWSRALPMPQLQFEVYDGSRLVGTCDFCWPELGLLGEFDGKTKYGRLRRPHEGPEDAVFREKRREDRIRRLTGFSMIRLTWADLERPKQTAAWLRASMRRAA